MASDYVAIVTVYVTNFEFPKKHVHISFNIIMWSTCMMIDSLCFQVQNHLMCILKL